MMKNQDIIRTLTEQELATKNVNTSFLMMPLRLETMFMDKGVQEIDEPERVIYVLKHAWDLLCFMPSQYSDEELKETVRRIERLHVEVEKLDVIYPKDKYTLLDIFKGMEPLLPPNADIHDYWTELIVKVARLQNVEKMKYDRATNLINQLEHFTKIYVSTITKPPYYGKRRQQYDSEYSQIAIYQAGYKHLNDCRRFLGGLKDEMKNVPWMTLTQKERMKRLLIQWDDELELNIRYKGESPEDDDFRKLELPERSSVKDAKANFFQALQALRSDLGSEIHKVEDCMCGIPVRNTSPYRFTKAAGQLFLMVIDNKKNRRGEIILKNKVNELNQTLSHTVFDYPDQQRLVRRMSLWVNERYSATIDCSLLEKYSEFVRRKGISNTKMRKCLCVRIYPDELAVTQYLRPLTKNEYLSGRDFWLKYIFAGDKGVDTRKSLWLAICDLWPAYRAAWIVRKTFPSKAFKVLTKRAKDFHIEHRSFDEYADEINANFLNAFPMTYVEDGQQVFDVPATELLPERFVLQAVLKTKKGKKTHICKYGHRLPQKLQLGLDLNNLENAVNENRSQDPDQQQGHILLNGSLRWMTDYDEAERMGMAITLPLEQFACQSLTMKDLKQKVGGKSVIVRGKRNEQQKRRVFEFESVYVMGINKESEDECEQILSQLLDAHLYSNDGYCLLNLGTATNILTDEDLKTNNELFDTSDEALVEKYKHQAENCVKPPKLDPDEDLALLQGIFALHNSVLGNIKDRRNKIEHREILKGRITNQVMLETLNNKLIEELNKNPEMKDFLSNDVLARGPFPPIRIGSQPYGILPICDFRNLIYDSNSSLYPLKKILIFLTKKWNAIANRDENYSKNQENLTTEGYLKVAGSTPISSYFRKAQSVKEFNKTFLLVADFFKFTDLNGKMEVEQRNVLNVVEGFLEHHWKHDDVKEFLNGFDEIPVIDDNSEDKFHEDLETIEIPNLVAAVKEKLGDLLNDIDEDKRDQEVKNLIIEFFDLFAYRLDAWMMGLLSNKLRKRMKEGAHRIAIGTYGWVFNLNEPKQNQAAQQESGEYLLAPSINQAVTGAVLRSAYKNSRKENKSDETYSVNLSSERVRNAIRIIEGVHNGLAIGTILGTDLERLLHDAYKNKELKEKLLEVKELKEETKKKLKKEKELNGDFQLELDEAIYKLRMRYPMVESKEHGEEQGEIKDNEITVINGAKLLEDFRSRGRNIEFVRDLKAFLDETKIIVDNIEESIEVKNHALLSLLDRIDDEYDALTDIILSEGVYKLTQGQREAVDALMQSLEMGKNIPMPQVAEIPISSAQVDGSLVVALNPADTASSKSLLASAEPKVDQWIAQSIGTDRVQMGFCDDEEKTLDYKSLNNLGVSASELVYLSANKSAFLRYVELKNWLQSENGVYDNYTDAIEADGGTTFDQVELIVGNVRDLLAGGRILRSDDLVKETGLPDGSLYETLQDKYDMVLERVQVLTENLSNVLGKQQTLQNPSNPDYDSVALSDKDMREALQLAAYCFSIGQTTAMDAVSKKLFVGANTTFHNSEAYFETVKLQHTFFDKLESLYENICEDLEEARNMVSGAKEKSYCTYTEAIQKLLVNNMLVVPVFQPDTSVVPVGELDNQKNTEYFKNVTSLTVDDNIQSLSKVSPQLMRYHQLRIFQKWNALDDDNAAQVAQVVPMQLPIMGNTPMWLGVEVQSEEYVNDAFTYMVEHPENLPKADDEKPLMAGLVFDHWIERIPYQDQTAGLAFNYDQPDAEAPQALLLAVATKDSLRKHWSENMMLRTIRSTVHLVKCRSVEPDDLRKYAWTAGLFPLVDYSDITVEEVDTDKNNHPNDPQ